MVPHHVATRFAIDFTTTGNSDTFVERGWGIRERHGRWTIANDCILILPAAALPAGSVVEMYVTPYVAATKCPSQAVIIYVDEVRTLSARLTEGTRLRFMMPATRTDTVRVRIRCPNAIAPNTISESRDSRKLGLSVSLLTALPAGEATGPLTPPQEISPAIPCGEGAVRRPRIAAVTMVYNEPVFLPIWLRHYGGQVGLEHCFVVDHGSDDGSTMDIGSANRIRLPRSPYDAAQQTRSNSAFCSGLLNWYDWVIYADVDELVMADPKVADTLLDYVSDELPEVVTAIGINCMHRIDHEPAIDLARPISSQRRYGVFSASMCKPLLTRRSLTWTPGSHTADAPIRFDHLYLFHLRWFDLTHSLARLSKTRAMPWVPGATGLYQRQQDAELVAAFKKSAARPRMDDIEFDPTSPAVAAILDRLLTSLPNSNSSAYSISLNIWAPHLWRMPERFAGRF